jgi:hypothetical protein
LFFSFGQGPTATRQDRSYAPCHPCRRLATTELGDGRRPFFSSGVVYSDERRDRGDTKVQPRETLVLEWPEI